QKQRIMEDLDRFKIALNNNMHNLSANSLSDLISRYKCGDIDELISMRESLALVIHEKRSNLEILKSSLSTLENDIRSREQRIEHLEEEEVKMHKKENLLKHAKYLKGEIDGFIS